MQSKWQIFSKGIIRENPLLILMIGLCSGLGITTETISGLGMGLAMTFVLVMSEIMISAFRKLIPTDVRIPIFIIVIATFTTIVKLAVEAYVPVLHKSLGLFIPLIVVNCIIMGRVEAFASKQTIGNAFFDALGMGVGYTIVLVVMSAIREVLGNGAFLGIPLIPDSGKIMFFVTPGGGFLVFGLLISVNVAIKNWLDDKAKTKEVAVNG